MAPQPLSKVKRDASVMITPLALRRHAWLGMLAGQCIATWSTVDAQLAKLLGAMLGVAWRPANAMFAELSSSTAQVAAIRGVAREQFKGRPRDADVFEVIMGAVASGWKRRNPLAHHLWGFSDDLDDALLLIDPRDDVSLEIARNEATRAAYEKWSKLQKNERPDTPEYDYPEHSLDKVMVYRERDFEELISHFEDLATAISDFSLFAAVDFRDIPESPTLARIYDELEARPLIAPALSRLRAGRKSAPSVQQQSPPKAAKAKRPNKRDEKG